MSDAFMLRVGGAEVVVNTPDQNSLLQDVRNRLRQGVGFAIATINLDHIVKLRTMAAFRSAYARQDIVTADGNPIVWLSRVAGRPVSLVTGSDLVEPLATLAAQEHVPVALLGATPETLEKAAAELVARNPNLSIVARLAPGPNFDAASDEATAMIAGLKASGARLAFLALGAPRQEMFAARCRDELPELGLVSVGAGLDFIAASQRRAPVWMRKLALEWLWRVVSNPKQLGRRYISCVFALPAVTIGVIADSIG